MWYINYLRSQPLKTAISLLDEIFAEVEALARQLGMSRSELYTEVLKAYL